MTIVGSDAIRLDAVTAIRPQKWRLPPQDDVLRAHECCEARVVRADRAAVELARYDRMRASIGGDASMGCWIPTPSDADRALSVMTGRPKLESDHSLE